MAVPGILLNNIKSPFPECNTTYLMMTIYSDILHLSEITPIFDPVTDLDHVTEFEVLPYCARFPATGVTSQKRTLTLSDTLFCHTLGFASVLMFKNKINHPISSNSHPSATANKAIHNLKIGGVQNQQQHHIIVTKFLIRDASNLENKPNSLY